MFELFDRMIDIESQNRDAVLAAQWIENNAGAETVSYENYLSGYNVFVRLCKSNFNPDYLLQLGNALFSANVYCNNNKRQEELDFLKYNVVEKLKLLQEKGR